MGGYAGVSSLFSTEANVSLSQLQHDNQIDGEVNALPTHTRFQIALKLFSHNRNVELKPTPQALQTPPKKSALLHLLDVCLINYANFAYFQTILPELHAAISQHLDTYVILPTTLLIFHLLVWLYVVEIMIILNVYVQVW
jgi:hypothetical protein